MPYPDNYDRAFGFKGFQDVHPNTPLPGVQVDAELDSASKSIDGLVSFVKKFSRADGKLANGSVGVDQLAADLSIGFKEPTTWESGVDYLADDTVFYLTGFYQANVAHTSGESFDPAKWVLLVDFGAQAAAAAASATQAQTYAEAAIGARATTAALGTTAALLTMFPASPAVTDKLAVVTTGRDTVGDRGGAIFYYDASDTTTADNGGTVRVDGQGRRWKAQLPGDECDVELFGVYGGDTGATYALAYNATKAAANVTALNNAIAHGPYKLRFRNPVGYYSLTGVILPGSNPHFYEGFDRDFYRGIIGSGIVYANAAEVTSDPYSAEKFVFQNGEYGSTPLPSIIAVSIFSNDKANVVGMGIMKSTTKHMQYDYHFRNMTFNDVKAPVHWQWANLNEISDCAFFGWDRADSGFIPTESVLDSNSIQKTTYSRTQFAAKNTGGDGTLTGVCHFADDSGMTAVFSNTYIGCTDEGGITGWNYKGERVLVSHHTENISGNIDTNESSASYNSLWLEPSFSGGNSSADLLAQRGARTTVVTNGVWYFPTGTPIEAYGGVVPSSTSDPLAKYKAQTTFTPTDGSGAALTFTGVSCQYEIIGGRVFVSGALTYPTTANGSAAVLAGFPVTFPNADYARGPIDVYSDGGTIVAKLFPNKNATTATLRNAATGAAITNAQLSTVGLYFSASYPAA